MPTAAALEPALRAAARQVEGGGGWSPALPLILAAWDASTDAMKQERFLEHLDWAASHGALDTVAALLEGLPEEQWLHLAASASRAR